MDRSEIAALLTQVSALDNRVVDEAGVEMWHRILEKYDYDDAMQALPMFFQKSDDYLSPRRLIAEIKIVKEQRALEAEQEQRRLESESGDGVAQPLCAKHELKILDCVPCCVEIEQALKYPGGRGDALADDLLVFPQTV